MKRLRRTDFMAAARANVRNTHRLVLMLLGVLVALGYLLGWVLEPATADADAVVSHQGLLVALLLLILGLLWTLIALRWGDRVMLRVAGARLVTAVEAPRLHNVVEEMAIAAGLPKPRVYVIETPALNAFATGLEPRRAAIGVTRGLLDALDRDELQGVVGHEMGHIVNLDMRYATVVGVLVGLVALVADQAWRVLRVAGGNRHGTGQKAAATAGALIAVLLFAALAPLFARLLQMAVSRQREYLADATSVRLTRNPVGLISALAKLEQAVTPFPGANRATQHLFIVNPLKGAVARGGRLMATHPPLADRIARLRNLQG